MLPREDGRLKIIAMMEVAPPMLGPGNIPRPSKQDGESGFEIRFTVCGVGRVADDHQMIRFGLENHFFMLSSPIANRTGG